MRVLPHGIHNKEFAVAHAIHTSLTTRSVDPRRRLLPLLSVAGKICYASSILFGISKEYLTRKFLPALCEASGNGFVRHWRKGGERDSQIHHHPGIRGAG